MTRVIPESSSTGLATTSYEYANVGGTKRLSATIDGNNLRTELHYDGSDIVSKIYSDGTTATYTYDNTENTRTVTERDGSAFTLFLGNDGQVTKRVLDNPGGTDPTFEYSYDTSTGMLSSIISPEGTTTAYSYNAAFQPDVVERSGGGLAVSTQFAYSADGYRVTKLIDELGFSSSYEYDSNNSVTKSTSADGTTRRFEYNSRGLRSRTIDANGTSFAYTYDAFGFENSRTSDEGGLDEITDYDYDKLGRLTALTTPQGRVLNSEFDAGGHVVLRYQPGGASTEFAYDNGQRLVTKTLSQSGDAMEFEWIYGYDSGDRLLTTTMPGGAQTIYAYDSTRLGTITSPEGRQRIYRYDGLGRQSTIQRVDNSTPVNEMRWVYDLEGRVLSRFDGNGKLTEYDYDGLGRRVTLSRCDGSEITYEYDAASQLLRRRESDGTTVLLHDVFEYDSMGRVTRSRMLATPTGTTTSDNDRLADREYDAAGRLTAAFRWLDASNKGTTAYDYDALGRLITLTRADDSEVVYLYDADGLVTNIDVASLMDTDYAYDHNQRLTMTTTKEGISKSVSYNAIGDPVEVVLAQGATMRTVGFTYDAASNLVTTTAADDTETRYAYDNDRLLTSITTPELRVFQYVYDDWGRPVTFKYGDGGDIVGRYTYDAASNVISSFDARGNFVKIDYTCFNRPASITDCEDGSTVYTYELPNRLSTVATFSQSTSSKLAERRNTYSPFNQLTESRIVAASSDDYVYQYSYDRAGRLTQSSNLLASGSIDTGFQYDKLDRVTLLTDPDQFAGTFAYNDAGRLERMTGPKGEIVDYVYDGDGRMTRRISPELIEHTIVYDLANRPLTAVLSQDDDHFTTRWVYDNVGNLTNHIAPNGAQLSMTYDGDRNLTGRASAEGHDTLYEYDTRGRVITVRDEGIIVREVDYDLASNPIRARDALGNEAEYAYDCMNRLTKLIDANDDETHVAFDALGRKIRVDRKEGSTTQVMRSLVNYDELGQVAQIAILDDPNETTVSSADELTEYRYDRAGRLLKRIVAFDSPPYGTFSFEYNKRGLVTAKSNPECDCTDIEYDASGLLTKSINSVIGATTTYAYDADRRQTLEISPEEISRSYVYDARGLRLSRTVSQTGGGSFLSQWVYDLAGNMVTMTEPDGVSDTLYGYDFDRRLTKITSPGARVTDLVYDARNRLVTTRIAGDDIAIRTYDDADNVQSTTDANGHTTNFDHDALNRITLIEDAEDHSTTYAYESRGRLSRRTRVHSDSSVETDSRREYDARGNLVTVRQLATPGTPGNADALSVMDYDRAGRMVTLRAFTTTTEAQSHIYAYDGRSLVTDITGTGEHRSFDYDSAGRRISSTDANNHVIEFDYDKDGRLTKTTSPEDIETLVTFDALNRRVTTTLSKDALSFSQIQGYDGRSNLTQSMSADGLVTSYDYDANRQLVTQTSPSGVQATFEYDARGRLITGRAEGEIIREVAYDDVGNAITITDARGNDMVYGYDATNRRTRVTDAIGAYDQMTLDARGHVIQQDRHSSDMSPVLLTSTKRSYDKLGRLIQTRMLATPGANSDSDALTSLEYDRLGQLTKRLVTTTAGGATNQSSFEYDGAGRVSLIANPDSFEMEYQYDAAGNRTKIVDEAGEPTSFAFDADRRQTKATLANGDYVTIALDIRGLETDVRNYASGGGTPLTHSKYSYDAAGRLTVTRRKVAPGSADLASDLVVQAAFDGVGRLTKTVSVSGNDTNYAYDEFDRITQTTHPDGSYELVEYDLEDSVTRTISYEIANGSTQSLETRLTLDVLGRPTLRQNHGPDASYGNADDITYQYFYDDVGRLTGTLDELGMESRVQFDSIGRRVQTTEDVGGIGRDTYFQYDRAGRLLEVVAENDAANGGNQTTEYAYNGRDLPDVVTYEVTGDVSMFYDERGSLTLRVDEAGTSLEYAYDSVNRLIERAKSGATAEIEQYVYDGAGRMITARKGSMADDDGESLSVFGYDALSLLQSELQRIGTGTAKTVYSNYDTSGRRDEVIYHDNVATVAYAYDSRDRCSSIDLDSDRLADYTWFGRGLYSREVTCDYPGGTKPKFDTVFLRDGVWRVTAVSNTLLTEEQADTGYSNLGAWIYSYDKASNPLDSLHTKDDMGLNEQDHEFTYDDLYRLATADLTDTLDWSTAATVSSTYIYDKQGNRLSHVYRNEPAITLDHNKANQMTDLDGLTPGYDLAGNQTLAFSVDRNTSLVYKYDHNNRITGVYDSTGTTQRAEYAYDALARRIKYVDTVNDEETQYYYDGANEIVETGGDGVAKRWYVHGRSYIDERLMMYSEELARPFYYAIDRMYNVRGLVDRAGALVETVFYDGFGRPLIRRSPGRGDMDNDGDIDGTASTGDQKRYLDAKGATIWDPRADLDDDGDVDDADKDIFLVKKNLWNSTAAPSVQRAFSHFANSFLWQGRPQYVFDTPKYESDASADELFGASTAISGSDGVVGSYAYVHDSTTCGAAFVYRYVDDTWEIRERLVASDYGASDSFGISVAIDGDIIVVGASGDDDGAANAGAAYVFTRVNGEWYETDKLYASSAAAQFGTSVAIDGDVIVVGAPNYWDSGASAFVGKVFVYRWDGDTWDLEQTLDADTEMESLARFGISVDVDGDVIAVGADKKDVSGQSDRGKFYIFRYNSGTSTWSEDASYAPSSAADDRCGASVSVSGDRVVAGAWGDNTNYTDAGAAYVVEYDSGSSTWGSAVQITLDSPTASDNFGTSVSIVDDRILVGTPMDDAAAGNAGAAYLYDYDAVNDVWDETGPLTASDAVAGANFGRSVSLGAGRFISGAQYDDEFGHFAGAAYGFELDGTWSQIAKITAELPSYAETPVVVIIDHRLRMYDPVTGKWLTRDPIGYLAGSWNIYEYVRNSPWRWWDPWGTDELDDMLEKGGFRGGTRGIWGEEHAEIDQGIRDLVAVADGVGQAVGEAITAPVDAVNALIEDPVNTVAAAAFGGIYRMGESIGAEINALQQGMSPLEAYAVYLDAMYVEGGALDHLLDLTEGVDRDGHVLTLRDKAYIAATLGIEAAKTVAEAVVAIGGSEVLRNSSVDDIATRLRRCSDIKCFTGGTAVLTADGEVPIEDIRVGDRVLTTGVADTAAELDVTDLQLVRLEMPTPDAPGDFLEIVLLRPQSWIEEASATDNEDIVIALPELGVEGPACVEAIEPCPPIEEGPGRIVLMTVTHFNGYVMEIGIEGSDTPIEPTRWHRLFSATDANWVPAAELNVGDELLTVDGAVRITSIRMKPDVYRVYNLEVDGDHEYFVGARGVLSHNSGITDPCRQLAEDLKYATGGGRYGDIRKAWSGGEVHHMPASSVSPYTHHTGPAIWMEKADHVQTASWGRSLEAQEHRARQAALIEQGKLREAIQMDIDDIRKQFGNKYDRFIDQMLAEFEDDL